MWRRDITPYNPSFHSMFPFSFPFDSPLLGVMSFNPVEEEGYVLIGRTVLITDLVRSREFNGQQGAQLVFMV